MPVMFNQFLRLLPLITVAACNSGSRDRVLVEYLAPVGSPGSVAPHLASTTDGRAVLSWLEPAANGSTALRTAVLDGSGWSPPVTIDSGDDFMVNWADFPSVTPVSDTLWGAHWLRKIPGGVYAYNVAIAVSNDGGATWSEALTPHDDGTATEHGFVSLYPAQGAIGAIWLDGRNTIATSHEGGHGGGTTLRSARIGSDGSISNPQLVDELICDCCQTDAAIGRDGPIVVYRDRSVDEIRDIHVARAVDGLWQADQAVADDGWRINGCPVNGPAIASDGKSVAVAWFTAAGEDSQVKIAWSQDDAASFGAAISVDPDQPVGRVDIELLGNGSAVVSWLRSTENGNAEICLRAVSSAGLLGAVQVIAETGVNRASGYPQIIRDGEDLVIAWIDTSGEESQLATARIHSAMLLDGNAAN